MTRFDITDQPIEPAPLRTQLLSARAGAFASFEGWVRDHNEGQGVSGLHYEAYAELARVEGEKILDEALTRFDIVDARCVHRVGELAVGEMAVWVGVSAGHRDGAFAACRWIIDETKARVPIWKQERYLDGAQNWLHPQADRGAAKR
ncbi:molybdenum cofactor biosynthesis protein MoaE [Pseudoxanthomonas winnipegensis]|jgi:molybdopterin synthase catalytic subunit|uniref:Molybdopterin synthase catalytic subunit n=1 Tax=Pseudoxanthomonas winnipegensis TaxID=2480810 RepID=A0ABY1WBE4_9GAMM|nr:molybdenum cofactor biosynthesis protein MoaE [Pseudoxanthomonas winnipegensis]TAA10874.1 molybdenum cofactor biosynthesis protein MoaE [Pseudoxanthomonas winnipegensis]TAA18301.1 molybdenum cofactor biosynthesis protein MoaE [Pseudoxanthomonas winnipegensis]TAH74325.1 molybdenum cofactor biosynthesis protein MoaE [Pseudoxanthomonas winnipegensis]